MKNTLIIIIAVLTTFCGQVSGQPAGTLDLTFNGTGKVVYNKDNMDLYTDVKVQSDGKIVAVGTSYTPTWSAEIEVTRYLVDGSFDLTFGTGGHFNYSGGIETGAYKCIIKDDGKILIGGYTTDYATYSMLLLQLNEDGTPDISFGTNGVVLENIGPGENIINALAVQDDGKILAAGYSQNTEYKNVPVILRFSATGVRDTAFGTDGLASIPITEIDNDFSAIRIQSDGKIVAAGHISNGMSWFSLLVARFNTDGLLDTGYGTDGIINLNLGNVDDEFYDLQLTPDDEAILAGFTVSQGDLFYHLLLMKFDASGFPDISFGLDGYTIVGEVPYTFGDAMVLQTDGKILIAGCTGGLMPANNDWALWRFSADGNLDPDFGTNGVVTTEFFGNADEALGIALYQDKIILAGKTRNATDYLDFAVARYTNDLGVSVRETSSNTEFSVSPNPVKLNGTVYINYELNEPGNFSIDVVNVTGTSVMTVPVGNQTAGRHQFQFDLPSSFSAGVYFMKIKGSQNWHEYTKLIVIN